MRTEIAVLRCAAERVNQECERDKNTACNCKRQHIRNTVHQMLIELSAEALAAVRRFFAAVRRALMMIDRRIAFCNAVDEFLRNLDAVRDLCPDDLFALKP